MSESIGVLGRILPGTTKGHLPKETVKFTTNPNSFHQVYFTVENWTKGGTVPAWSALGDVGGFTPTAGYQKINVLDRPQQTGNTIYAGFDPYTATLPLIIDTRTKDNCWSNVHFGNGVVEDIWALLEWAAGLGVNVLGEPALKNQTPNSVANVGPVAIKVKTIDGQGNTTNVIPAIHQNKRWYISALAWGDRIRDSASGNLTQAKVTVTLEEVIASDIVGNTSARFGSGKEGWHKYKVINPDRNTIMAIVQKYMHITGPNRVSTAKAIKNYSGNSHLNIRNVHTSKISKVVDGKIKNPKVLWLPKGAIV